MDDEIGKFQYIDEKRKWFGMVVVKQKEYLDFVRKVDPLFGIKVKPAVLVDAPAQLVEFARDFNDGNRLGNMLEQFAPTEEDEQIVTDVINEKNADPIIHKLVPKNKFGVHATHCCVVHGCKYGHPNCPVVSGEVQQEYLCESCEDIEGWTELKQVFEANIRNKHPYEACADLQGRIEAEEALEASEQMGAMEEEELKPLRYYTQYKMYVHCLPNPPTTMDKLHLIEACKVIYDIHYAFVGIGIVFYDKEKDTGDYKSGLSVEEYYDTFEDCINAECDIVITMMEESEAA